MSLIKCPECGKQISDTVLKCIHCGCNLKLSQIAPTHTNVKKNAEERQYYKIPYNEQITLRNEFYTTGTDYSKNENLLRKQIKKLRAATIIQALSWLLALIVLTCGQFYYSITHKNTPTTFAVVILVAVLIAIIFLILTCILKKNFNKYRRNQLIVEKKFQKWLREEKQIVYTVNFTPKQKKEKAFFDSINAERSDLER